MIRVQGSVRSNICPRTPEQYVGMRIDGSAHSGCSATCTSAFRPATFNKQNSHFTSQPSLSTCTRSNAAARPLAALLAVDLNPLSLKLQWRSDQAFLSLHGLLWDPYSN